MRVISGVFFYIFVVKCFNLYNFLFGKKVHNCSLYVAESIPLQKSENLSAQQCKLVIEKLESSTLSYLFSKSRDICKVSFHNNKSWQKKILKSAQPSYLEFFNEIYPSKLNAKLNHLSKSNRTAMLSIMGTGDDYSKCFILGFSGYGNRGIWSAAVAKGLASQFYDNKVPLRWDIVAGISSGAFNAVLSSHFNPGGFDSKNNKFSNEFLFKETDTRSDSYICSNIDKDLKFEFWFKLNNSNKNNVKCYSPGSNQIHLKDLYAMGNNTNIENELSYTNFMYEIYMNANSEVVNDNCFIPTSQDSTKWWSTILLTLANLGKKPITSFCTMNGWKKLYRDSILKYLNKKREAIVSASRLFDGTLINWSIQYIGSQIFQKSHVNQNSRQKDVDSEWISIDEDDAAKLADIATASNAVSGVYMPIKVNNEYFVWGGLRGESNLEAAIERCKEIKPGIKEEEIVIDFITGSYYREDIFLAGSYIELLGKEGYFEKIFRKIQNYVHRTGAYARPDPPQLFELFNRAWEFITASSRGMYPIKSLIRRYPKVKIRFIIRPKTLRFFPKSSYLFPSHKNKILIMTDGYYTGYNATIVDVNSIETKSSV